MDIFRLTLNLSARIGSGVNSIKSTKQHIGTTGVHFHSYLRLLIKNLLEENDSHEINSIENDI